MATTDDDAPNGAPTLTDKQRAFIDGLRDMADLFESVPALCPSHPWTAFQGFWEHDGGVAERMGAAARAAGGRWAKNIDAGFDDFRLERGFGPHRLVLFTERANVCERVVTGTKTVTREIPDPDAPPPPTITVTEEVERVEWVCSPLLADREAVSS